MSKIAKSNRIVVGIATRGRQEILLETLLELGRQTHLPDRVIVSYVNESDVSAARRLKGVEFLASAAGLPHQRNAILSAIADEDFLLFLDDDFFPAPGYIEATLATFHSIGSVVVTTGRVLVDGAKGPGLSVKAAHDILTLHSQDAVESGIKPTFNGYGCNMAFRLEHVRAHSLRFDERLPLYAWYEDVDMCRRLGLHGDIVEVLAACGVHLGIKQGRGSGLRLGYSQVVNPFYLWRKGSYPWSHALRSVGRHIIINGVRACRPEPWVDRRGRLIGNSLALLDIMLGRAKPERVLDL